MLLVGQAGCDDHRDDEPDQWRFQPRLLWNSYGNLQTVVTAGMFPAPISGKVSVSNILVKVSPEQRACILRGKGGDAPTMTIALQDVLKTNIVLAGVQLLKEPHQRDAFADAVGEEVEPEIILSGAALSLPLVSPESGFAIPLRKERTRVESLPSRTIIEQSYPVLESLERLAEVAAHAINLTNQDDPQTLTAFGINTDMVYRHSEEMPSEQYVAEKLFPHQRFFFDDLSLAFGLGRFSYTSEDTQWNFGLEPRANDSTSRKVFMSLNLHVDRQQAPDQEEILGLFRQAWDRSWDLAKRLDGGE